MTEKWVWELKRKKEKTLKDCSDMYTPTQNSGQFHAKSDMTPNFYPCKRTENFWHLQKTSLHLSAQNLTKIDG